MLVYGTLRIKQTKIKGLFCSFIFFFLEKRKKKYHGRIAHFSNETVDVFVKYKHNHYSRRDHDGGKHTHTTNKNCGPISGGSSRQTVEKNASEKTIHHPLKPSQMLDMKGITVNPYGKDLQFYKDTLICGLSLKKS